MLSLLPWAPAALDPCPGANKGDRAAQAKCKWGKDRQDIRAGTRNNLFWSLALQLGFPSLGMVLFSRILLPKETLQAVLASRISLMTVHPLCSLSSSCQRWDGCVPGGGFALLF